MAENEQFKRQQEVDLVALAYEAALNGGGTTGVMEGLLRLMDAEAGVWIGGNVATQAAIELAQAGLDETMMHSYNRLGWQSPLAPLVIQGAVGRPQTDEMLLPRAQFQQSEFFQEWVRPTGLMQGLLATLKPSTEEIVILSLMRTGTTNFTRFDKAALQRYGEQRIKWIGRRSYRGAFIAKNHLALQVCIKKNALVPRRAHHPPWFNSA